MRSARWHAREGAVIPWRSPDEARARVGRDRAAASSSRACSRWSPRRPRSHHPRYLGHQVAPPLPGAALAELVSALLNNGTGVFEMGPAAVPIELAVIEWMCAGAGLPADAGGTLTSGGSLGNLTALLAMRQARAGYDAWRGAHARPAARGDHVERRALLGRARGARHGLGRCGRDRGARR